MWRRALALAWLSAAIAACGPEARPAPDSAAVTPPPAPPSTTAAAAAPATESDTSVQVFWVAFRRAALDDDVERVAQLTQFPLRTRGQSDEDPEVVVERASFPSLFARLMRQDPGLAAAPETMRALLERTTALGPRELGPAQARVGALEFARTGAGWRLVFAYTEE